MKKLLLLAAFLGASVSLFAQGTVTFANLASQNYRLTTNSAPGGPNSGLMSGVNAYRIGLYAGPSGSAEGALTLVGIATNSSVPAWLATSTAVVPSLYLLVLPQALRLHFNFVLGLMQVAFRTRVQQATQVPHLGNLRSVL